MASSSALTGFSTTLLSTFISTSDTEPGPAAACAGACSVSVLGNHMLATTPTVAAASVPTAYSTSTGRMCVVSPGVWLLMAAITSTNTSTGATAFRAEMNNEPSMAKWGVAAGHTAASTMPMTTAMAIWVTRQVRCTQRNRGERIMI